MKKFIITLAAAVIGAAAVYAQNVPTTPQAPTNSKPKSEYRDYSNTNKGFWASVDVGSGVALTAWSVGVPLDITGIVGYRVNEFIKVGFGFGGRGYFAADKLRDPSTDAPTLKNWSFPLFLNARGDMFRRDYRDMVPFWNFDIGYAIQDGFFFAPGLGLSFGSGPRHKFNLGIHYVGQCARVFGNDGADPRNGYINMIQLKLGYEF